MPSWTQLKYFSRFFTGQEKIAFNVFLTVSILGALGILGMTALKHITLIPSEGGEYSEALIGQPKYINPLFSSINEPDQDIGSLVYAGLFRYQGTKLVPQIAESYAISTDTKSFDIKLRHDIRFADGKPLTSSDVVYTFDLIQNPEVASPLLSTFQGIKVETLGDYEVLFTLKAPYAPFLNSLTVGILPEHIWSGFSAGGLRLADANLRPMGAGPWQFSKSFKDSTGRIDSITLVRNDNYFDKKPFFKTVRFKFFDENLSALEAVRSQSVDALSFVSHDPNIKLNNNNTNFYSLQLPEYTALFLNQSNEPALKNLEVRQALSVATDRQQIITNAIDGYGAVVNSPVLLDATGDGAPRTNVDAANTLLDKNFVRVEPEEYFKLRLNELEKLDKTVSSSTSTPAQDPTDEAKLQSIIRQEMDSGQTFYRRDKNNKILELTITTADTDEYSRVAKELAKMWEQIGIKTTVETNPVSRLIHDKIKNRSYSILLYSEIVGGDPDPYAFWHSSQIDYPGLNLAGFSDRDADKLLEDARSTVDEGARADLYSKFDKIISDELPAIFLYTPLQTMAVNKEVRGVSDQIISSPFDRFNELSSWYTKRKLKWK